MSRAEDQFIRHHDSGITWFQEPTAWDPSSGLATNAYGLGSDWSCVVFLDRDDDTYYNGKLESGLYSARFGRRTANLEHRVSDFLRYERAWGRHVVVASEYPLDVADHVADALSSTPQQDQLRPYDPSVVVHSTTHERWPLIADAGRLLSASELRQVGVEIRAIGFETFGEPPEYGEFIHFAPLGKPNGEVVVLSHQRGELITDFEAAYVPGARIYLDAHRMIRNGITVRDGLHVFKVHLSLELGRYLLEVVTPLDFDDGGQSWTPQQFADLADDEFRKKHARSQASRESVR